MLATCYLPRQWPAKYFRLCRALRPCSGWERVVYLRLVTSKLFIRCLPFIQGFSSYAEDCIRYIHQLLANSKIYSTLRRFSRLCNQRLLRYFASLRNNGGLAKPTLRHLLAFACANATRGYASFIFFRKSPRPISISRLKMLPLLHL